jgi:hypothetical protein
MVALLVKNRVPATIFDSEWSSDGIQSESANKLIGQRRENTANQEKNIDLIRRKCEPKLIGDLFRIRHMI